jgi:hypothetical protein
MSISSYDLLDEPTSHVVIDTTAKSPPASALSSPPAQVATAPQCETLTLALVTDDGERAHYGIVPFPETYEACVGAAIGVLGPYMTDPREDNVILRCSTKNRKGVWVWGDIARAHWKLVLGHYGDEVGVFEIRSKDILGGDGFVFGKLYFTFGKFNGTKTYWRSGLTTIDRPWNFKVRVFNILS